MRHANLKHLGFFKYLLQLYVYTVFFAGLSPNEVHQSPGAMIVVPGETIEINCNHSNSNFYMIQWYKQSVRSTPMTLIGFARYDSVHVEDRLIAFYNVSGDGRSLSSLYVVTLSGAKDSVMYYCAASDARCCINLQRLTKTLSHTITMFTCSI